MSKHSMRRGGAPDRASLRFSRDIAAGDGAPARNRWRNPQTGVAVHEIHHLAFAAALRRPDLHLAAATNAQPVFKQAAILEICRHMNLGGNKRRIQIVLLENRAEELAGIEGFLIFPEEFPLIDNTAAAHVKDGDGNHSILRGDSRKCRCRRIPPTPSSDARREMLHGFDRVTVVGRHFELLAGGCLVHPHPQSLDKIAACGLRERV